MAAVMVLVFSVTVKRYTRVDFWVGKSMSKDVHFLYGGKVLGLRLEVLSPT